jgi:hypothetical protein
MFTIFQYGKNIFYINCTQPSIKIGISNLLYLSSANLMIMICSIKIGISNLLYLSSANLMTMICFLYNVIYVYHISIWKKYILHKLYTTLDQDWNFKFTLPVKCKFDDNDLFFMHVILLFLHIYKY